MNLLKLNQAVEILSKYEPDGYVAAEHDEIFLGGLSPEEIEGYTKGEEDLGVLEDLGVHWNEELPAWTAYV